MRPTKTADVTRVLGEAQDEYSSLPIRDQKGNDGSNRMISVWKLTE